jgi:hypothetical protein
MHMHYFHCRVFLLQLLQQHCILLILSLLKWEHNSVFLFFFVTCQCQNGFTVILCHQKNKTLLSHFTQTRIILIDFHNSVKYKISQKSFQWVDELICVDRQTDRLSMEFFVSIWMCLKCVGVFCPSSIHYYSVAHN